MALKTSEEGPKDAVMRNDLDPLILDLLEWIGREPRAYADVIDAWRTSCPRLTVWEDAIDRGFVAREHAKGREVMIRLTALGREFLREHGRAVVTATLVWRARCSA
jgi:DNA-binding MarR family transcriptional regulator